MRSTYVVFFFCVSCVVSSLLGTMSSTVFAQTLPFEVVPQTVPPYYYVRYEGSETPGELVYPVIYTVWVPPKVETLRGVIVHQHGCGQGAAFTGLTGAFDLHWQALAKKHHFALLSASYEQPSSEECRKWADPRNGSQATFLRALADLGAQAEHPELSSVPWALWGHSGGGYWVGGMTMLHPKRVLAAWLRSGGPRVESNPERPELNPFSLTPEALTVPMMLHQGAVEGITDRNHKQAKLWPLYQQLFHSMRSKGALIAHSVDIYAGHGCGNQRYFAIPWFDHMIESRLPQEHQAPLMSMPVESVWLAPLLGNEAVPAAEYKGNKMRAVWLPNQAIAEHWMNYMDGGAVADLTPPPAPTDVVVQGNTLTWNAEADLESGLAYFIIERDGEFLAKLPQHHEETINRPVFQPAYCSDKPKQPLPEMRFIDSSAIEGVAHKYRVKSVNTDGLESIH